MFKFYFQSGEFYADQSISWIGLFKDFLIPLAGVGVPLLLFYLGIRQERKRTDLQRLEDIDKSDRIENLRLLYFHSLLQEALKYCWHFEDVLMSQIATLTVNKYTFEDLEIDGDEVLKRIVVDLDRESLFYAYRMRIDDQALTVIFKALDAAYGLQNTFILVWEKTSVIITTKMNEIRSSTSSLGLRVVDINIDDDTDQNLRNQLMMIFVHYDQKDSSEARHYQDLIEIIVNPIASAIEEQGKTMNVNWKQLYQQALNVQILDKQVDSIVNQYFKTLSEISTTLDRVIADLIKHYLPLEDYLINNKHLLKRLSDEEDVNK